MSFYLQIIYGQCVEISTLLTIRLPGPNPSTPMEHFINNADISKPLISHLPVTCLVYP